MMPGNFVINLTGSGDSTLIAAPPAPSFIEVAHYHVMVAGPTVLTFKSGSEVIDVCYAAMASGGGIANPFTYDGLLRCNPGQALVINSSNPVSVGGAGKYSVIGTKQASGWGAAFGTVAAQV